MCTVYRPTLRQSQQRTRRRGAVMSSAPASVMLWTAAQDAVLRIRPHSAPHRTPPRETRPKSACWRCAQDMPQCSPRRTWAVCTTQIAPASGGLGRVELPCARENALNLGACAFDCDGAVAGDGRARSALVPSPRLPDEASAALCSVPGGKAQVPHLGRGDRASARPARSNGTAASGGL